MAFTPREEGEHLIHLRKDNKEVEDSPFSVIVGAKEEKVEREALFNNIVGCSYLQLNPVNTATNGTIKIEQ